MDKKVLRKIFIIASIAYVLFTVGFYFLSGESIEYGDAYKNIKMPSANELSVEITNNSEIFQSFIFKDDSFNKINIVFSKRYQEGNGLVNVELLKENETIGQKTLNIKEIKEQKYTTIEFDNLKDLKDKQLAVRLTPESKDAGGLYVMMSTKSNIEGGSLIMNGTEYGGLLCFSTYGPEQEHALLVYWIIMAVIGTLLAVLFVISYKKYEKGYATYVVRGIAAVYNYKFLISQLVSRDFKSKYKRSVLGVFWSFLNPLLTMAVQYFVFSNLFTNSEDNYIAYLLLGTIMYSFFSEATSSCLESIVGNAGLISKVYVPKYIYPFTKLLSSLINFGLTLIPTIVVCAITGIVPHKSSLLFFYFVLCLIVFTLGVGFLLSSLMVFFRDTRFLWSVLSMLWMYATPIFYSVEIIPEKYSFIYRFNPLYYFLGNARACIINGVSPSLTVYGACALMAVVSLAFGVIVFKKTQDNFTLHL